MMLEWRLELEILEIRRWIGMQSNALEKSIEATVVRRGLVWLKPLAMEVERFNREEVVE